LADEVGIRHQKAGYGHGQTDR